MNHESWDFPGVMAQIGVDELTKEHERDESHGEEKWCGCTFHVQ